MIRARPAVTTYTSSSVCGSWVSDPFTGTEYVPMLSDSTRSSSVQCRDSPVAGAVNLPAFNRTCME